MDERSFLPGFLLSQALKQSDQALVKKALRRRGELLHERFTGAGLQAIAEMASANHGSISEAVARDLTGDVLQSLGKDGAASIGGCAALVGAISRQDHGLARRLLAAGARGGLRQGTQGFQGSTALMMAAKHGWTEGIELLLASSDPNERSQDGATPLIWASAAGCFNCCRLLLSNGADVNAADEDGITPLSAAICGRIGAGSPLRSSDAHRREALARLLASHGGSLGSTDGSAAIATALLWRSLEDGGGEAAVATLASFGARANGPGCCEGASPLFLAATLGCPSVLSMALEPRLGESLACVAKRVETAMILPKTQRYSHSLHSIVEIPSHGLSLQRWRELSVDNPSAGDCLLSRAAYAGQGRADGLNDSIKCMRLILDIKEHSAAEIDRTFQWACSRGVESMRLLSPSKARLAGEEGKSLLEWAAFSENPAKVGLELLAQGVDPTPSAEGRRMPLSILAARGKDFELAQILIDHGACLVEHSADSRWPWKAPALEVALERCGQGNESVEIGEKLLCLVRVLAQSTIKTPEGVELCKTLLRQGAELGGTRQPRVKLFQAALAQIETALIDDGIDDSRLGNSSRPAPRL